jgi:hypothetical protein
MSKSEGNVGLFGLGDTSSGGLKQNGEAELQRVYHLLLFWFVDCHREDPLPNHTGMVCSHSQLLADITTFPEVHFGGKS